MHHLVTALALNLPLFALSADSNPRPDFPGKAKLILPTTIYALEGLEANLYFDNTFLLLNPASVLPDVTCSKGSQQTERWTWTPAAKDIGDHAFALELRNGENRVVARASSTLKVRPRAVASVPARPMSLLVIGDSLTAASTYPAQILALAKEDAFPLKLIGTRGPGAEEGQPLGEVRHEGYGGWTAERFATHYTGKARGGPYRECGSPFLYKDAPENKEEKPHLDFARYCGEFNEGTAPDCVTLLLGCNDTFSATDETIAGRIDTFLRHTETLIAMIRSNGPETRIGLILPMPPAASQDAFGANYGSGQTRWQYRRNQHRLTERVLEIFAGREGENLFLVPAALNLDPVLGFPATTVPAHADTEVAVSRQNNGVHPSAKGYRQIGDAVYAWLRSFDTSAP